MIEECVLETALLLDPSLRTWRMAVLLIWVV